MIPVPIIDWAVWANLDNYKEPELILLKGHLLIEVMLITALEKRCTTLTPGDVRAYSFYRKVTLLQATVGAEEKLSLALQSAEQLNLLRNMLAHELFANGLEKSLTEWAERVLSTHLKYKHQRFTARTKLTHAMAALAREIYESSLRIDLPG